MVTLLKFYATLRVSINLKSMEIDIETPVSMREILFLACQKADVDFTDKLLENNRIKKGTLLLIDGKNVIHMQGLDTMVTPGSTVSCFPPSGGG